MSQRAKREYFASIWERYQKTDTEGKSRILDEFCKVCKYSRNYAIRKLNRPLNPKRRKPGRKPTYDENFIKILSEIWLAMHRCCSKKMIEAIPLWLRYRSYDQVITKKLTSISAAQIDRVLAPLKNKVIRGKSLTPKKAACFVKRIIPLKPLDAAYTKPGFIQSDTVAHCGDNIAGFYAFSLTMTDIFTSWTENRATWTKSSFLVSEQIKDIERTLPFPILGYSADNGHEVLNERIYDHFTKRAKPVVVTRGRPRHSNDQAYVEQRNNTHVRGIFGYERFDERGLVDRMNEIYKNYWNPLQNFFIPTMKCIEKKRNGSKVIKKYDKPKTPYQRILDSADVAIEAKQMLRATYEQLNPFELSQGLDRKLQSFFGILKRLKQSRVA
jgi:hypothetical protein